MTIDHINQLILGIPKLLRKNYTNTQRFLEEIDAAAVYVNASPGLQTVRNLALEQKSASVLRSFMPEVYGTACFDHHQIHCLWKWTGTCLKIVICFI